MERNKVDWHSEEFWHRPDHMYRNGQDIVQKRSGLIVKFDIEVDLTGSDRKWHEIRKANLERMHPLDRFTP